MNNITFECQKSEFYHFKRPFAIDNYALSIEIRILCGFKHLYMVLLNEIS